MRLIKRQTTNMRSIAGKGIQYDVNDQIIMDSKNVVKLPKGSTAERPAHPTNGHMRYNTSVNELEVYQDDAWRKLRFKEPNQNPGIVQQTFTGADGVETVFGILNSGDADYPIDRKSVV